jgi:hypothetical protein
MIALIPFIPVIGAMGGNVGAQSSTIVVRGFATGRVDFHNLGGFLFKELVISTIMGLACGALSGALIPVNASISARGHVSFEALRNRENSETPDLVVENADGDLSKRRAEEWDTLTSRPQRAMTTGVCCPGLRRWPCF